MAERVYRITYRNGQTWMVRAEDEADARRKARLHNPTAISHATIDHPKHGRCTARQYGTNAQCVKAPHPMGEPHRFPNREDY